MPLRGGRCDEDKIILCDANAGKFRQDAPAIVGDINKVHPPNFGNAAGTKAAQPFIRAIPLQPEARKPGQVKHAAMIAHGFAFFANARLPWSRAVPCLGGLFGGVIARLGKPIGAFPAIISPHLTA